MVRSSQASFDSQAPTEEDVDESADPIATTEPPEDDSEGDQEEKSETDIDEDNDIEEDEDADSSFDAGAASAASPSPTPTPEPSPSKRSPKKPAVRSSPIKRTSPVKSATPARKARASSDDDRDENEDVENEGERAQTTGTPSKAPLRESVGQQDASFTSYVSRLSSSTVDRADPTGPVATAGRPAALRPSRRRSANSAAARQC